MGKCLQKYELLTQIYIFIIFFSGLSGIIRRIVLEQIGYFMVLPHKFSMAMTESVSTSELKCPDSAGVLRVNLIRAIDLMKKDIGVLGLGKSDPYATLVVGAKTVQTKTKPNTITPEWYFTADFPIEVVKGMYIHCGKMRKIAPNLFHCLIFIS